MKTLPGRGGVLRLRPLTQADLRRHDLGRTSREVSLALHAHHDCFWSDGGPTDLGNLVLVCARHHTLIPSQGFQLLLHPDRRLDVHTAELARSSDVSADTLTLDHIEPRIDLGYVVNVLLSQAS